MVQTWDLAISPFWSGKYEGVVHDMDNLHWKFEEIYKQTVCGNEPRCYVLKSRHHACAWTCFQQKNFSGRFIEQAWSPNVMVKCSHFGSGSILHIVNIDECLYRDDWILKLEFNESVFSMAFQGEDWFGALSDLQFSNEIASETIGATVGMGSTVSVPEKE